jgi:cholesterol oxidase
MPTKYDHDWIIVGSGFGGSVSALRMAEKGYDVKILECGRRFADDDFAESMYRSPHRYHWKPFLKLRGIFRMTFFKDVTVLSGCGVGGGSLGYANTLYRALPRFFNDKQWVGIEDWENVLAPHYDTAERMLGVTEVPLAETPADRMIKQLAEDFGVPETYKKTRVGVYFGDRDKVGETVPDPYFDGEGPDRAPCHACGGCMMGCRHNAKNTLVKNYLWFAEKLGVKVDPLRTVTDIKPIRAANGRRDGSAGYEVTAVNSGAWFFRRKRTLRARGVVVSSGTYGTNKLLVNCKLNGSLPRLSHRLGDLVRTNSEAILAVTAKSDEVDYGSGSVAISSSFFPDENTHIENVTYGEGGDMMGKTFTLLTGEGNRLTRPLKFLLTAFRHPLDALRILTAYHWSRRTIILLVMQTLDNSLSLRPKKNLWGGYHLSTEEDAENPNPRFIPAANKAAELAAAQIGGVPQSSVFEVVANVPTTAHFLGGAVIGRDANSGVVDHFNRAFGYDNLLICDGSTMPANPGVNPSLTITAITEHAMTAVPPRTEATTATGGFAFRAESAEAAAAAATVIES